MADSTGRAICWRPIGNDERESWGLEHLLLRDRSADSVILAFDEGGRPFRLAYQLAWDESWRLRDATLAVTTEGLTRSLRLLTDGQGHWQDGEHRAVSALDGCLDIDIWPTPFTNSPSIWRLFLNPGERREIEVVFVEAPQLTVRPMRQAYTRLDQTRYLYQSLDGSGFEAVLTLDEDGLVNRYPLFFQRL